MVRAESGDGMAWKPFMVEHYGEVGGHHLVA